MRIMIDGLAVLVVLQRLNMIDAPDGILPDLIVSFEFFALLGGGIGLLGIGLESRVANNFVNHRSYIFINSMYRRR